MKTFDDYLNDPRLVDDPDYKTILEPERRLHAIRLKMQDETEGMTGLEWAEYYNKKAEPFLKKYGYHFVQKGEHGYYAKT